MDEVGYGALAGPLVAVAVAADVDVAFDELRRWWPLPGVRDSKKTTPAQRARVVPAILRYLVANGGSVGLGSVSPAEIDDLGYSRALERAKVLAVAAVIEDAPLGLLVVDGSVGLPPARVSHVPQRVVPRADADYWVVAAASMIAKQYRDQIMEELDREWPQYAWCKNMGYTGGSKAGSTHVAALRAHGLSPHHRRIACQTVLS